MARVLPLSESTQPNGGNVTWLSQFDGNWIGDISVPENIPVESNSAVRLEDGARGGGSTPSLVQEKI